MNEGDVIDALAERSDAIVDPFSALAVAPPVPRRFMRLTGVGLEQFYFLAGIPRLAMIADQPRFVIEGIALAGGAGHEELYDALGPGSEMGSGKQTVGIEQAGQRDPAKSAAELPEKLPPIRETAVKVRCRRADHVADSDCHPRKRFAAPRGGIRAILTPPRSR